MCQTDRGCSGGLVLAERVGFEPTEGSAPSTVFKTAAFNRSAISPPFDIPRFFGAYLPCLGCPRLPFWCSTTQRHLPIAANLFVGDPFLGRRKRRGAPARRLRLSLPYALLVRSPEIRPAHVIAARRRRAQRSCGEPHPSGMRDLLRRSSPGDLQSLLAMWGGAD